MDYPNDFESSPDAMPVKLAMQIVEGSDPLESLVTETEMPPSSSS